MSSQSSFSVCAFLRACSLILFCVKSSKFVLPFISTYLFKNGCACAAPALLLAASTLHLLFFKSFLDICITLNKPRLLERH